VVRHLATPSQRAAIEAAARPVLLVAGPGSGKTFCLIERIRFLVEERGVAPERIVAFTFTNKAAEEIASRLEELGPAARAVKRTTIHKFCVDTLREHGTRINVDPAFGIADEDYQCALLARLGSSQRNHRGLLQQFARHRLRGDPLGVTENRRYERYLEELAKCNMLDFDMLLLRTADALEHAEAAQMVRAKWDAILVDEFQDLNPVQYSIVRTLARDTNNVFAVGDYDQSIYGWAGAEPKLFQQFMNDFRITETLYLRENHRTPRDIFQLARRFVEVNPMLPGFGGRPEISALREPEHPIGARVFENEREEAEWLVRDIKDQRTHDAGLNWGDFGLLYRTHEIGNVLEPVLLMNGIPCRLAHGRAVSEDPVIAYVVAALGVMLHPADMAFQERFLEMVLPRTLTAWARSEGERRGQSMLKPLRDQMDRKGQNHEEIRRAVASLKNLGAFLHRHDEIGSLLEELLSRRVGKYRNPLAERHLELDDPETDVEASTLAFRLNGILKDQRPVQLPHLGGAEIPIKAMLHEIGVRTVHLPGRSRLSALGSETSPTSREPKAEGLPTSLSPRTVFKAAQILTARKFEGTFQDFTAFDLETTGLDTRKCEIVEIAAVRVRNGQPAAEFHRLVKPRIPIEPGAAAIHMVDDAKVASAPFFEQVWPEFRDFCGDDVLVAHNGEEFDFPVLRRMAKGMQGAGTIATYDSMPLAYEITPKSHKLGNLARDYNIPTGREHSALDDAKTLALVFARLNREKVTRSRKASLLQLLDHLGVALALERGHPERSRSHPEQGEGSAPRGHPERSEGSAPDDTGVLFDIARPFALGVFSEALDYYESLRGESRDDSLPTRDDVIERLGGHELMERIRAGKTADERYPASMLRLRLLTEPAAESREPRAESPGPGAESQKPKAESDVRAQIATLLERVALSGREVGVEDAGRVNLLTLHATKGLEFSRVYIVGAEDEQFAREKDGREQLEESRRVFYVGMTRAKDRLVFTRALSRNGKPTDGSRFLDELAVPVTSG